VASLILPFADHSQLLRYVLHAVALAIDACVHHLCSEIVWEYVLI
jgi:hypothetical protein